MPAFIVVAAAQKKVLPDGKKQVVNLTLKGEGAGPAEGESWPIAAEWFTDASTPLPAAESKIEGDIEKDPQWGWKFKQAGGGRRGGGGGGGPKKEDERQFLFRQRSIAMQNSIGNAIDCLKLAAEHGDYKPPSAGDVNTHVERIAQRFFGLIEAAANGQAAPKIEPARPTDTGGS